MSVNSLLRARRVGAWLAAISIATSFGVANAQGFPNVVSGMTHGFLENRGQWDDPAKFCATFGNLNVWVGQDGLTLAAEERTGLARGPRRSNPGDPGPVLTTRGAVVRMRFEGSAGSKPAGEGRLGSRFNWFIGNDRAKWVADVGAFASVRMPAIVAGTSVVGRQQGGHFEYDLVLDRGVAADTIIVSCKGQDSLFVDERGELVMRTAQGDFRQTAPVAWEEDEAGRRATVACRFRVLGRERFGFDVPARDLEKKLVIDPGIIWSSLLLGAANDEDPGNDALVLDSNGNLNLCGVTTSPGFPVTVGAYSTTLSGANTFDAWVARFTPGGQILWCTFLGGNGFEWARDLAIGANNVITVGGNTTSSNFPAVLSFDASHNGTGTISPPIGDGFLARFNPMLTGTAQLTWSTLIGGSNDDIVTSIAVDSAGLVTAGGWTWSSNMPGVATPNALQGWQGVQDGFVCRFDPSQTGNAQLTWFTFLGGASRDYVGRIKLLPNGRVVTFGGTSSGGYPLANAYQSFLGGGTWDVAVSILDPSLSGTAQLVYSTFLGGFGSENEGAVDVDRFGRITVGGWTNSANFPTTPLAFDTSFNVTGAYEAFITRIDPTKPPASQLVFSTFVGGSADEGVNDLFVDASGGVHAVGSVASFDFPATPGCLQPAFLGAGNPGSYGPYDGFALLLEPNGTALHYSTFLGGAGSYDFAYDIARDACGSVFVAGITRSADFPHNIGTYSASDDTFLLMMELLPNGASRYGSTTPGCAGPLEIGVNSMPSNGNNAFALTCTGAPANSVGLLGISGTLPINAPLIVSGLAVWIDPFFPGFLTFTPVSDAVGYSSIYLNVPSGPQFIGLQGFAQFGWADPCAPGGLSGSCGMLLTVQ